MAPLLLNEHRQWQHPFLTLVCRNVLRNELGNHEVEAASFAKLDDVLDSELLDAIEGRFEILITLDRNLAYQQQINNRQLAVIVLQVAEQMPEAFRALIPEICKAIGKARSGKLLEVE